MAALAAAEWHLVEKQPDKNIQYLFGIGGSDLLGFAPGAFLHFTGSCKNPAIVEHRRPRTPAAPFRQV